MNTYTRKRLSKELFINPDTLLYYEKINLIKTPIRNHSGYRIYNEKDKLILQFILKAKEYGFTLKEIKNIISALYTNNNEVINPELIIDEKIISFDKEIEIILKKKKLLNELKTDIMNSICPFTKESLKL